MPWKYRPGTGALRTCGRRYWPAMRSPLLNLVVMNASRDKGSSSHKLRQQLRVIVFGTSTKAGRLFDIWLIVVILFSVVLVFLESIREVREPYGDLLHIAEWTVTIIFIIEYAVRLWISDNWRRYAMGFFGIVDLVAILPSFISLFIPGSQVLAVIRALRLVRVFRILHMFEYVREAQLLLLALVASRQRLIVFMLAVLALVTVFGTIVFLVETPEAGFTSVPRSIYWAIVTLTTVGYGDIAPRTTLGQMLASLIMILGYAIIAIPTGIVSVEMAKRTLHRQSVAECTRCGHTEHLEEPRYCNRCGEPMPRNEAPKGTVT
jgi:voltage-gated potassium channel